MRLAIIHFEANEAKIFEDVIRRTQETISHTGIFDSIKNAFFLAPLIYSMHKQLLQVASILQPAKVATGLSTGCKENSGTPQNLVYLFLCDI